MGLLVGRPQPLDRHVGVDLGGRQARVAEHSWTVRRSAPPSSRWVAALCRSPCGPRSGAPGTWASSACTADAHLPRVHPAPPPAEEQRRAAVRRRPAGVGHARSTPSAPAVPVRPKGTLRSLAPLPITAHDVGAEVHVVDVEADQLPDADAGGVEQLEHGAVAQVDRVVVVGGDGGDVQQPGSPRPGAARPAASGSGAVRPAAATGRCRSAPCGAPIAGRRGRPPHVGPPSRAPHPGPTAGASQARRSGEPSARAGPRRRARPRRPGGPTRPPDRHDGCARTAPAPSAGDGRTPPRRRRSGSTPSRWRTRLPEQHMAHASRAPRRADAAALRRAHPSRAGARASRPSTPALALPLGEPGQLEPAEHPGDGGGREAGHDRQPAHRDPAPHGKRREHPGRRLDPGRPRVAPPRADAAPGPGPARRWPRPPRPRRSPGPRLRPARPGGSRPTSSRSPARARTPPRAGARPPCARC